MYTSFKYVVRKTEWIQSLSSKRLNNCDIICDSKKWLLSRAVSIHNRNTHKSMKAPG